MTTYTLRDIEFSVRPVRRFKSFDNLVISQHQAALDDIDYLECQTGVSLDGLRKFVEQLHGVGNLCVSQDREGK